VGGIISNKKRKKNVNASKIEMHSVIFSPELDDNKKTRTVKNDIETHGIIRLTK
jgi:hypothetical protein